MDEITEEDKEAALDHDAEGEKELVAGERVCQLKMTVLKLIVSNLADSRQLSKLPLSLFFFLSLSLCRSLSLSQRRRRRRRRSTTTLRARKSLLPVKFLEPCKVDCQLSQLSR